MLKATSERGCLPGAPVDRGANLRASLHVLFRCTITCSPQRRAPKMKENIYGDMRARCALEGFEGSRVLSVSMPGRIVPWRQDVSSASGALRDRVKTPTHQPTQTLGRIHARPRSVRRLRLTVRRRIAPEPEHRRRGRPRSRAESRKPRQNAIRANPKRQAPSAVRAVVAQTLEGWGSATYFRLAPSAKTYHRSHH